MFIVVFIYILVKKKMILYSSIKFYLIKKFLFEIIKFFNEKEGNENSF